MRLTSSKSVNHRSASISKSTMNGKRLLPQQCHTSADSDEEDDDMVELSDGCTVVEDTAVILVPADAHIVRVSEGMSAVAPSEDNGVLFLISYHDSSTTGAQCPSALSTFHRALPASTQPSCLSDSASSQQAGQRALSARTLTSLASTQPKLLPPSSK